MGAILPAVARILREADVERVLDMDAVIGAVTAAMRELAEGKAQNEPRRRAFAPGALLNVMFASYPGGDCMGLKVYSIAGGSVRFLVNVFGLDGSLRALIEADRMGAYRTGAASAVAAKALARPGAGVVALIGAGYQAERQALALSRVLQISELRVFSRDQARREAFAAERAATLGINVVAAPSAEAAVRAADVVIAMTTSSVPVLEADWVKSPALVIAAGSNFANRAELSPDLVARAQTIVVDQLATARIESGDLIQAHAAGKFEWERATELATVVAGGWKPADPPGITIFESHGLALWDMAAASVVLPAAIERGLGEEISLLPPGGGEG
jgi:alanine dehydrogenase